MKWWSSVMRGPVWCFGRSLPALELTDERADWQAADPRWIRRALAHSQELPGGAWYVLAATRSVGDKPQRFEVCGSKLVLWRSGQGFVAGLDACPHMGAALSEGHVCNGQLICPWHGLALGPAHGHGFRPLPTFDDGYLVWVQLTAASHEDASERPYLPERPAHGLDAVIQMEALCEPQDVVANRLDPWHGTHYHPHSFARLHVIAQDEREVTVRVAYRVAGPLAVEVDARFHCPDPRTIVMTILAGDGQGSVVETHATPIRDGVSVVTELTLASSDRPGFGVVERAVAALRPLMRSAARRLWVEDARYAERTYALRQQSPRHAQREASAHPAASELVQVQPKAAKRRRRA